MVIDSDFKDNHGDGVKVMIMVHGDGDGDGVKVMIMVHGDQRFLICVMMAPGNGFMEML